jgi:hypothetical protein
MGRTRKSLVLKRRNKIRKLLLKGIESAEDIANHPDIVKEFGKTSVATIRRDLSAINKWYVAAVEKNPNILEKQAEYILKHLDQLKMVKERLWDIENKAKTDKDKVTALKAVLDELKHESKVLKLIDVSKTINNYIKIDKIGILVNGAIEVIREFVPKEQQKYALQRLKKLGDNVIDVKKEKE